MCGMYAKHSASTLHQLTHPSIYPFIHTYKHLPLHIHRSILGHLTEAMDKAMDEGAWDYRNVPLNGLCSEGAPSGVHDLDEKEHGGAIAKADRKAAQMQYEDFLTVRYTLMSRCAVMLLCCVILLYLCDVMQYEGFLTVCCVPLYSD